MTSPFDPNLFLTQTVDGEMQTKFTPVPEGEYVAAIDDVKLRQEKTFVIADVLWNILDDTVKATLGMNKVIVRQSIFLDIDDSGRLSKDPNKNIQLGRIREALGQNSPGVPWSIVMLKGAGPVKARVSIRVDKDDATKQYNDVKNVTRLAA